MKKNIFRHKLCIFETNFEIFADFTNYISTLTCNYFVFRRINMWLLRLEIKPGTSGNTKKLSFITSFCSGEYNFFDGDFQLLALYCDVRRTMNNRRLKYLSIRDYDKRDNENMLFRDEYWWWLRWEGGVMNIEIHWWKENKCTKNQFVFPIISHWGEKLLAGVINKRRKDKLNFGYGILYSSGSSPYDFNFTSGPFQGFLLKS